MVGTTPLTIHVADIMPMSSRMSIDTPASPTVFLIISSNTVHFVLYTSIDRATHTDEAGAPEQSVQSTQPAEAG